MRIKIIKRLITSALCCLTLISACSSLCIAGQQTSSSAEVEATIREFWEALGNLDATAIKRTLDWPTVIIETSATGAMPAVIVHNEAELDAEFKRANPDIDKHKRRGDFYGLAVKDIKVQMLNEGLAYVIYRCELKKDLLPKEMKPTPEEEIARGLNVITVLRRNQEATGNKWKIVLVNVPK